MLLHPGPRLRPGLRMQKSKIRKIPAVGREEFTVICERAEGGEAPASETGSYTGDFAASSAKQGRPERSISLIL